MQGRKGWCRPGEVKAARGRTKSEPSMNLVEAPRDWRRLQAGALTGPPNLTSALPSKWKGQAKVILISSDVEGGNRPQWC